MSDDENLDNLEIFNDNELNDQNEKDEGLYDGDNLENYDDINIDEDQLNNLLEGDEEYEETKTRSKPASKKRKSNSGEGGEVRQPRKQGSKREEDMKKIRENIRKEVKQIKDTMEKIHSRDVKAVKENKPALNKIKNVDEIIVKLSKLQTSIFKSTTANSSFQN